MEAGIYQIILAGSRSALLIGKAILEEEEVCRIFKVPDVAMVIHGVMPGRDGHPGHCMTPCWRRVELTGMLWVNGPVALLIPVI